MDIEKFKEEFVNLIRHFTVPTNDENVRPTAAPLTYRQILGAVTDVLNAKLNADRPDSSQDVRTPAAGIIVTTPDAPDIPKVSIEHGEICSVAGRYRSLDTLTSDNLGSPTERMSPNGPSSLPAHKIGDSVNGSDVDGSDADGLNVEKKADTGSNQSVSTLVRSDTYVRENGLEDASNDDLFDVKTVLPDYPMTVNGNDDFSNAEPNVPEFRKRLNILRDAANEMMKKMDDLEIVVPETTRPIRRLSTIGCCPGINRASATARTIQRPKMSRRSLTSFPGTPTSSRLSPGTGKIDNNLSNGKNLTASTLATASRLSMPSNFRSVSSGALTLGKKDSPSPSQGSRLSTGKITNRAIPATLRSVSSGALKFVDRSSKSPIQGSRQSSDKRTKTPIARSPALSLMNLAVENQGRPMKNPKYARNTLSKVGPVLGKRKADEF